MEILTEMENVWHEAEWRTELILDRSESLFELKLFSPFVVYFYFYFFWFSVFGIWRFWFSSLLSVFFSSSIFSFFVVRFGSNHMTLPKLVKQVCSFCLPVLSHSSASHPCPQ